jgi:glycosyltransferase involved in cell wall biosynthesis
VSPARRGGPRPRIGLVAACRFPAPRGSQVLIDGMARAFAAAGVETHLVAPLARGLRLPYRAHPLAPGVALAPPADPVAWPRLARLAFDAALAARLDAIVRRERLTVLHAHNYEALAASLLVRRLRGVPVVFHAHAVLADELPHYAGRGAPARRRARRFGAWCDRALPRLADHVVALSEDVAGYLVSCGVPGDRVSVIPPGVDPDPFRATSRATARRAGRAVFAGNLDGYQNLELLLDAWDVVAAVRRDAELSVVTHAAPPALAAAIAQRGLAGRVRVVRARSLAQVSAELAGAAVGVSPRSSWSGFPMKTLNYMASAVPTVAVAGSAKGIRDGVTGWVVREATAAGLGATLLEALEDPAGAALRGRAASELAHASHAWATLTPSLLAASARAADGV